MSLFCSSTDYLEQWERFLYLVGINANPIWVIEPISGRHNGVQCGGLADGTQTTFPLPAQSAASTSVFVDDVLQDSSGYTVHSAANTVADNVATDTADGNPFAPTDCTVSSQVTAILAHGEYCRSITPDAASTCSVKYPLVSGDAVSVGSEYTASVALRGPHACKISLQWLDSGDSILSTDSSSGTAMSESAWIQETITATAPASTVTVRVIIEITSPADTDPMYLDCFSLGPGDLTDWFLPSQSPAAIEFAAAPSANARVIAHVTGYRMARCRLSKPTSSWSISSQGHAAPQSWVAEEEVWK